MARRVRRLRRGRGTHPADKYRDERLREEPPPLSGFIGHTGCVDEDDPLIVSPVPGADGEGDESLGEGPRFPRWLVLAGIGVLGAAAIAAVTVKNTVNHASTPPPVTASRASSAVPGPSDLAGLSVQDFALDSGGELYVLTKPPEQLVAVDRNGVIRGEASAPAGGRLVVANKTSDLVWVVVPNSRYSEVFVYVGSRLTGIGRFSVPAVVSAADALGNQLWMATDRGIYRGPRGTTAVWVPGFTGDARVIAADPLRFRLLAVSKDYDLIDVDEKQARVVRRLSEILPKAVAVTRHDIWFVGFGQRFGSRLGRVDPHTLRVTLVDAHDAGAPQGAEAWTGDGVLWIKYAYTGSIVCIDARTGEASDAFTDTDSPVVSIRGLAYAVRGSGVVQLPTTAGCPG